MIWSSHVKLWRLLESISHLPVFINSLANRLWSSHVKLWIFSIIIRHPIVFLNWLARTLWSTQWNFSRWIATADHFHTSMSFEARYSPLNLAGNSLRHLSVIFFPDFTKSSIWDFSAIVSPGFSAGSGFRSSDTSDFTPSVRTGVDCLISQLTGEEFILFNSLLPGGVLFSFDIIYNYKRLKYSFPKSYRYHMTREIHNYYVIYEE